jgi:hypothetical protein
VKAAARALRAACVALVLATALAVLSAWIHRVGPEQVVYSNLCGPTNSDLCYKPVLKGGFPFAYLFDAPGVSREDQLAFGEDNVHLGAFALDVALYFAAVVLVRWAVSRRTGEAAASLQHGNSTRSAA